MTDAGPIMEQLRRGLPGATHRFGETRMLAVRMRDGTRLATRLYVPAGPGPWPSVLIRSPYPGMRPYLEATSVLWTEYGYAAVLQDCRGTGQSEGEWTPFVNEGPDGLDTIGWMLEQGWSDGSIGTYGHSYLSAAQWAMADRLPPEVKAMALSGFTTERYRQNYMNGMFRHDVYTGWALENTGLPGVDAANLFARAVRIRPHREMDERLLGAKLPWYRQWIDNAGPDDEYWSSGFWAELRDVPSRVRTPVLMIDGWFDQHLDGMVRDYLKLPPTTRAQSRFIVGPWVHSLQPAGDYAYPNQERNPLKDALEWFDYRLKGRDYPYPLGEALTYVVGEGWWKAWRGWIRPSGSRPFFLDGNRLADRPPDSAGRAEYRYDPDDPVPTRGGAGLLRYLSGAADAIPASSVEQAEPGYRGDVVTFLSEPLEQDLRIAGSVSVHLHVSSDAEDTAFSAVLMEVRPDGRAFNIRDGITSLAYRNGSARPLEYEPRSIVETVIELWPIVWTIRAGCRLRLDVSSSNFPAYHAHSNLRGPWASQTGAKVAHQIVHFGKDVPSRIVIPYSDEQEAGEKDE